MAKCNQLTPLPFEGLISSTSRGFCHLTTIFLQFHCTLFKLFQPLGCPPFAISNFVLLPLSPARFSRPGRSQKVAQSGTLLQSAAAAFSTGQTPSLSFIKSLRNLHFHRGSMVTVSRGGRGLIRSCRHLGGCGLFDRDSGDGCRDGEDRRG